MQLSTDSPRKSRPGIAPYRHHTRPCTALVPPTAPQVAPNRKELGLAFKKDQKVVIEFLEKMCEPEALAMKVRRLANTCVGRVKRVKSIKE